jgi:hypothetical protein
MPERDSALTDWSVCLKPVRVVADCTYALRPARLCVERWSRPAVVALGETCTTSLTVPRGLGKEVCVFPI